MVADFFHLRFHPATILRHNVQGKIAGARSEIMLINGGVGQKSGFNCNTVGLQSEILILIWRVLACCCYYSKKA
jgi:hypothetical protein